MHDLKNIFNRNNNDGRKGMVRLIIPGLLLLGFLGIHFFGISFHGSKLSSSGYLWPILMGSFVVGHVLLIHSFKGRVGHSHKEALETDIISKSGLHWHPKLAIYVKGVKQEIPNIGLSDMSPGMIHQLMMRMRHGKHDGGSGQGIIHLKFRGLVCKSDITLGHLFKKWGKDIRSFGTNLKMTVNGKENTEYENYVMQDKDKIELHYE